MSLFESSRIKNLIAQTGLSSRAFALKCKLRPNTLSNQLNGIREISLSTITAILTTYPEVSAEWLMRGNGDMFIAKNEEPNTDKFLKLLDTIALMQGDLNAKSESIALLTERIKQLELKIN